MEDQGVADVWEDLLLVVLLAEVALSFSPRVFAVARVEP